jgi:aspartyl-tRNA(Asn)/glutamyl-tRNA(Gln) amidotransferase subunit A
VENYLSMTRKDLSGWRIAFASDGYFTDGEVVDLEVLESMKAVSKVFEKLGAQVELVPFPNAREATMANGLMTPSDAAAFHHQRLAENPDGFGRDVLTRLRTGAAYTSTEYSLSRRMQTILRCQFTEFFEVFDLLMTPTTPTTAPLRGSADAIERARLLTRFTAPFNLTGLPALSVPCGWTSKKMPIGLQIIGKAWAEAKVLLAGRLYEHARGFHVPVASLPEVT